MVLMIIKSGEAASPFRIAPNAPGVSEKENMEDARTYYSSLRALELNATAVSVHFPRVECDLLNFLKNIQ